MDVIINMEDDESPSGVSDSFDNINIGKPNTPQSHSNDPSNNDGPPPDDPSDNNPHGDGRDVKDPYLTELTLMLDYFQAHVNFFMTVINMYKNTNSKSATEAYRKDMQRLLPPKPTSKQLTTHKKKDILQTLSKMQGIQLLNALKPLLSVMKNQKEIPLFNAKERDVNKVKNIIIQGEKSVDFKQKCVLKEAVALGDWLNHLSNLLRWEFNTFISDTNNIKYGIRWVHKLRSLSRVFGKYKTLQNLSLTINQASQIAARVEKAIETLDFDDLQFWIG